MECHTIHHFSIKRFFPKHPTRTLHCEKTKFWIHLKTNCWWYITLSHSFSKFLLGNIEVVDIGCMMFAVVELHNLSRDYGLKSIVVIRKVWQCVLASETKINISFVFFHFFVPGILKHFCLKLNFYPYSLLPHVGKLKNWNFKVLAPNFLPRLNCVVH